MKRKFKQWWSSFPPISAKQTITSHLNSLNTKWPWHMTLEIQVLTWNRHKNVVGLNGLMGFQPSPLGFPIQTRFHSKRPHTITKMNDNINMDSTIEVSMNDNINMDSTIEVSMNDNINMDSTIEVSMNHCC